jgi:RNA polymerase sigma-70 factor (ECF subfamily)
MVDLEACIAGDKHAWDVFVDRWAGVVYSAVRRTMRGRGAGTDRADVEDAVQDVFVRLLKDDYRLLKKFDPQRASLSTWLTLIARSATIDRHRKQRLPTVPLEQQDPAEPRVAATPALSVPTHVLTARQRLVLRLLFDESRTVAEAARFLDVDEQTVRSTKHKALSRLRAEMDSSSAPVGGDAGS